MTVCSRLSGEKKILTQQRKVFLWLRLSVRAGREGEEDKGKRGSGAVSKGWARAGNVRLTWVWGHVISTY